MNLKSRTAILIAYEKGYRVLDDGTLLSPRGKKMRATPSSVGYPSFKVVVEPPRKQRNVLLHVFAAYCWYGEPALDARVVRHKDDVKTHCTRDNILLGSYVDNRMDMPAGVRWEIARKARAGRYGKTSVERELRYNRIVHLRRIGWSLRRISADVGITKSSVMAVLVKPPVESELSTVIPDTWSEVYGIVCDEITGKLPPTTEQRREWQCESVTKRMASTTPEQRSEAVRKAHANMTPEQRVMRAEKIRLGHAARTPEQKKQHGEAISRARRVGRT
jgi:hypothetical protein